MKTIELMNKNSLFYLKEEIWMDYNDFKDVMQTRELYKYEFQHNSNQLEYRNILIEHLKNFAIQINATHCCLHLSIYLLDIFMDNHTIILEKLITVCTACFILALKLEDNISKSHFKDILAKSNDSDHTLCEKIVLEFFDWYIMFPTAAHFLYYYESVAITDEEMDYIIKQQNKTVEIILAELDKNFNLYLNKIIDDIHYIYNRASLTGAAIIAASRFNIGLSSWSLQLQILTSFSSKDIDEVLTSLLRVELLTCAKCM